MNTKYAQLIKFLLDAKVPVTSTNLAKLLGVSSRTIKTYINDINSIASKPAISSSSSGYLAIPDVASKLLESNNKYLDSTIDKAYYIIRIILMKETYVDIYDLCEEFFISESTLRNEIKKINKLLERFNVNFIIKGTKLFIEGSESDKRRLLSHTIFTEMSSRFVDVSILNVYFGNDMVSKVQSMIKDICNENGLYIDEYSQTILLQHLLIAIERAKNNNFIETNKANKKISEKDIGLMDSIYKLTTEYFDIDINPSEQYELLMLFKTSINALASNLEDYPDMLDKRMVDTVLNIIYDINENFQINLLDHNFLNSFLLHISTFLERASYGNSIRNPMLDVIKRDCPMVYDVAVYFMVKLNKEYSFPISEDEIAYFALHIGSEILRQKDDEYKIKCLLLCPNYLNLHATLTNNILMYNGDDLNVIGTISDPKDIDKYEFDLLVSTVDYKQNHNFKVCVVSPFFSGESSELTSMIKSIKKRNEFNSFIDHFDELFSEELFIYSTENLESGEIIEKLSFLLQENEYVSDDFYSDVLAREKISSTSFLNFAIPHSEAMAANKSCVSVLINPQGINWNGTIVYVVFLPAIAKQDKKLFRDLYTVLISILSDSNTVKSLSNVTSFDQFKAIILSATK